MMMMYRPLLATDQKINLVTEPPSMQGSELCDVGAAWYYS